MSEPVPVEEHLRDVLARCERVTPHPQALLDAQGLPAAEDVVSPMAVPSFDNSAMDGYAVRTADLDTASEETPVRMPVRGEVHAGAAGMAAVQAGSVLRIMTGAPVPPGADAVVPFEQVREAGGSARFIAPVEPGRNIRRSGSDVQKGDPLITAGTLIGPREIGLLANVGLRQVSVSARLRVVVMSTGAELTEPGQPLRGGAIYDSNSFLIAAAVRATGAIAYRVHCPSDEPAEFLEALDDQLVRADVVITTGGVSRGTRDVVKAALLGHPHHQVGFRQVAMQPGKPQGFGLLGPDRIPIFALPGNPVSAYVSFQVFVEPALRAMVGRTPTERPRFRAVLQEPITSSAGKRQFVRGRFTSGKEGAQVTPVGGHGSHLLGDLAHSNALVVVDEDVTEIAAGQPVPVLLLDREY